MLDTKAKAILRTNVMGVIAGTDLATGFNFAGMTKEGAAFTNGEDVFVVKAVVKAESFDLEDALAEYEEAEKARMEKAAKAAAKGK
jgi:hypothetical protein